MNDESVRLILQLLLIVATGGGIYAAVRAELREAFVTATRAMIEADKAHTRIDVHINDHLAAKEK